MILKNKIYSCKGFCDLLGIDPIIKMFVDHREFYSYLVRMDVYVKIWEVNCVFDLDDEDHLNEWYPHVAYIPVRAYSKDEYGKLYFETKYYKVPKEFESKVMAKLLCEARKYMDNSTVDLYLANLKPGNGLLYDKIFKDYIGPTVDNYNVETVALTDDCYAQTIIDITKNYLNNEYGVPKEEEMIKDYRGRQIDKVMFNPPATIVFWRDGSKTVVKAQDGEPFDKEKGLAMAYVKKCCGNLGNYNDIFRKWCKEESND